MFLVVFVPCGAQHGVSAQVMENLAKPFVLGNIGFLVLYIASRQILSKSFLALPDNEKLRLADVDRICSIVIYRLLN